jgi:phospholipase A2
LPVLAFVAARKTGWQRASVLTLAGCGLWTIATGGGSIHRSAPLKADSARSCGTDDSKNHQVVSNETTSSVPGSYSSNSPKPDKLGEQTPPPQTVASQRNYENDGAENRGWNSFLLGMSDIKWSTIPDKITGLVVPEWFRLFPSYMSKFQNELSMAPGTLAEEIWREANDPECNPEILWDASVRVSDSICDEEKQFLALRKLHTIKALAQYLNIPARDIHPDDVPVIAMCGSGGGLRALVAGSGSYIASREAGLFNCATYTAGVSGSCWLQTLYFSSMGKQNHSQVISHLKSRLGVHIAYPPAAFGLVNSAPTNKFLLTGLVEKLKGMPEADFGIVDVYGLLLAGRLLVPKGELGVDAEDLKLSTQQRYISGGQHPMPIYSAVRHEIPPEEKKDVSTEKDLSKKQDKQAWFQWFEYVVGNPQLILWLI